MLFIIPLAGRRASTVRRTFQRVAYLCYIGLTRQGTTQKVLLFREDVWIVWWLQAEEVAGSTLESGTRTLYFPAVFIVHCLENIPPYCCLAVLGARDVSCGTLRSLPSPVRITHSPDFARPGKLQSATWLSRVFVLGLHTGILTLKTCICTSTFILYRGNYILCNTPSLSSPLRQCLLVGAIEQAPAWSSLHCL